MSKLLGYVWMEAMGDTQFHSFQTGFVVERASEGVEDSSVSGTVRPQECL